MKSIYLIMLFLILGLCAFSQEVTDNLAYKRQFTVTGCTDGTHLVASDFLLQFEITYRIAEKDYQVSVWKDGDENNKKNFSLIKLFDNSSFITGMRMAVSGLGFTCPAGNDAVYNLLYFESNASLKVIPEDAPEAGKFKLKNGCEATLNISSLTDAQIIDIYKEINALFLNTLNQKIQANDIAVNTYNSAHGITAQTTAAVSSQSMINAYESAFTTSVKILIQGTPQDRQVKDLLSKTDLAKLMSAILIDKSLIGALKKIDGSYRKTKSNSDASNPDAIYEYLSEGLYSAKPKVGGNRIKVRNKLKKLISIFYPYKYKLAIADGTQVRFEDGLISEIQVVSDTLIMTNPTGISTYNAGRTIFSSGAPISFSTLSDYRNLKNYHIYDKDKKYSIDLGKLIEYIPRLRNYSYDKSPANQIVQFDKGDVTKQLSKDAFANLIQAAVFSDFVGIGNDKPNGLIQTELWKQVNIYSKRFGKNKETVNAGFFTYIKPSALVAKIDNKNRRLDVNNAMDINSGILLKRNYATTASLAEYMSFYAGVEVNSILLALPNGKTHLYLNHSLGYGLTAMRDSVKTLTNGQIQNQSANEYNANLIICSPADIKIQFFPDERFGLYVRQNISYVFAASDKFAQVSNANKYQLNNDKGDSRFWMSTSELYGYVDFLSFARVFARYRFNFQVGNVTTNYHQAQLGFSVNILGSLRAYKKPVSTSR
ncbi:MAG: hypothetical protein JST83_14065 [Bacteroidetes bacterium]|nr:hypothetical protein [Bacteroidota bacterium]